MLNRRTLSVMRRELKEKLLSKSFIISTLLIPVFSFGVLGLQTFLMRSGMDSGARLCLVSDSAEVLEALKREFSKEGKVKAGLFQLEFVQGDRGALDSMLKDRKGDLLRERLTGILFLPGEALKEKKMEYYAKSPTNRTLQTELRGPVNRALMSIYFGGRGLAEADLEYAAGSIDFKGFRVTRTEGVTAEGYGNLIASFLLSFLLYFSLIFQGVMMMRSVVEEKTNRIVEVLLSSVTSLELMTGKIVGISITGLLQMAVWVSPLVILITTSLFTLPPEFVLKINLGHIAYFLLTFFVGILTYTGLFAMVGAIFDNEQDAQSGQWPIMLLIMIPFFIAVSMTSTGPDAPIARVSSLLPFASIMVMTTRMTLTDLPAWLPALALLVNLITMAGVFVMASKIYRIGILMTGKKPKWSEVARWLRQSR